MSNKAIRLIKQDDLSWEIINHGTGQKKVFVGLSDTLTQLTQFAYGELQPGEVCLSHKHPTMEEYFYFLDGKGVYVIDGTEHIIRDDTFLRIPANTFHHLECRGKTSLCFVYFGVALVEKQVEK